MANQENDVSHQKPQVAVVMVPLPAQGHLNQLLHLSRLISAVNLPVYYIGAATHRGSRKFFCGDIYNSSRIIEDVYLNLLSTGSEKKWAVGPFNPVVINPDDQSGLSRHKCLDWLDKQGLNSVIYISFGTTSSFSDEQIKEIAIGLEKSNQKFIWVLREADKGDIFTGEIRKPELPDGFEERVKERGLIRSAWASMATWPMHSDQPTNAVLVTKVLRIGVEVRDWACREGVVPSGVVENSVKKLMASGEGDEMRKRAKELGDGVKSSLMEGGISRKEMDSFIAHITR
ncbi:hypothetical protein DH2020_038869 [Rehmannia glutinosa]|uniref:Glycosyltransferase N-terminal domain-containing protein n=1 Tax=Rehmannia glutinosa TaxID=99300 RepID=A0ABR0UYM7_REHGL